MKLRDYFWKSIKKEKTNFLGSVGVFAFLFLSLQLVFGFTLNAVNTIYYFSPGYQEGLFYSVYGNAYYRPQIPYEDQGVTWDLSFEEKGDGIVYTVHATEACVKENLGICLSSRLYLRFSVPPEDFVYPSDPYSVSVGYQDAPANTIDDAGKAYPLSLSLELEPNKPFREKVQNMGYSWYGAILLIDRDEIPESADPLLGSIVRGHEGELPPSYVSGKELNDNYVQGRTNIPTGFFLLFLIPFLLDLLAIFSFLSSLQRKMRDEILSLRPVGAKLRQCRGIVLTRRLLEAFAGFLVSLLALPFLIPLAESLPLLLLLGEGIEVLYVLILLAFRSNSESKKAFFAPGAERKKKHHA